MFLKRLQFYFQLRTPWPCELILKTRDNFTHYLTSVALKWDVHMEENLCGSEMVYILIFWNSLKELPLLIVIFL